MINIWTDEFFGSRYAIFKTFLTELIIYSSFKRICFTDYVYNPKEARLRKAMREQSRELSRRSILQSAIARASVIAGPVTSGGFLDHQHRFGCVSSANIPMNSSMEPVRVAEPWFQSTPRPKPIHSPRMTDWYGNVADPFHSCHLSFLIEILWDYGNFGCHSQNHGKW